MRSVALLRGLNVGAHNRISTPDLLAVFEAAGCRALDSYIQSGNVLFDASAALLEKLPGLVAAALREDFGIASPVIVRNGRELAAVVKHNPFLRRGDDPSTLHVAFLDVTPAAAKVKALDPKRSPPDEFIVKGREAFLHCPQGLGRSKLTNAWFDSKLEVVSTVRNWNTVLELARRLG